VGLWILLGLLLGATGAGSRRLGSLQRQVRAGWERVEFLLGRRHALVPTVVAAARDALPAGGEGWETLTAASRRAAEASGIPERAEAENGLSEAVAALRARVAGHADPSLQASLRRLASVEAEIAAAGRDYNLRVMAFNQRLHRLPWRLFSRGLRPAEYLVLEMAGDESTDPVRS
jgi:LemA protein